MAISTFGTESTEQSISAVGSLERKLWTREEYLKLVELFPEQRFELIEGELINKMRQKRPHARCILRLQELLSVSFSGKVQTQLPIALPEPEGSRSEPEPDVVLLNKHWTEVTEHPGPEDIHLVIEVADTSLHMDRHIKSRLYARSGILNYWIVELPNRRVIALSRPSGGEYTLTAIHGPEEQVSAASFTVRVADIFI